MPLAACILLATGIHAQVFEFLLGGRTGYILDAILTVFFVVGITASFSILDHMDGLCAGVAATASIFFALLAYLNGQTLVTTLAAAVLGAATGFLRWNFKPAKIFMGDGGAMFLGFLMATLGLKLRLEQANHISGWLAPLLILGSHDFRHYARHDFAFAARTVAFCHPGQRPCRSPPGEPGTRAARRCCQSLYSWTTERRSCRARELPAACGRRSGGGGCVCRCAVLECCYSNVLRMNARRRNPPPSPEAASHSGCCGSLRLGKRLRGFAHTSGFAILSGLQSHRFSVHTAWGRAESCQYSEEF